MIHQHQKRDEGHAVLGELDRIHKNLWTYQHEELLIALHFPEAITPPTPTHKHHDCMQRLYANYELEDTDIRTEKRSAPTYLIGTRVIGLIQNQSEEATSMPCPCGSSSLD